MLFGVVCSLAIGLAFGNPLMGIGLGTVLSMLGVGRVIYFLTKRRRRHLQQFTMI